MATTTVSSIPSAEHAYAQWVTSGYQQDQLQNWLDAEAAKIHTLNIELQGRVREYTAKLVESEAFWRTLVQTASDYISVLERDGRICFVNHIPANVQPEDIIGTTIYENLAAAYCEPFRDAVERVFTTGLPQELEIAYILPRIEELHWYQVRLAPVKIDGMVARITCISTDRTEQKLVERLANAANDVTRVLAQSEELSDATPGIIQAICANLDWDLGAIWIVDRPTQVLRCVGIWHQPGKAASAFEQQSRTLTLTKGIGLPGRVWERDAVVWLPDVVPDPNFPRAASAAHDGLRAACGFPIRDGDAFLGVIEFFSRVIQPPDQNLLAMMASVGGQISHFIERRQAEQVLRDRQREFALARQVQLSLLPQMLPELPNVVFGGASRFSQETGGDYFDFFPSADGTWNIAVGDASGHGIGAALIVADARSALRTLALTPHTLPETLRLVNQRLCDDIPPGHFVTLFLGRLDPTTHLLTYSSAGHCTGYVLDMAGNIRHELASTNMPLGVDPDDVFETAGPVRLEAGDLVVLFTDGAPEAMSCSGAMFGVERVLDLVRTHRHETPTTIGERFVAAIEQFCHPLKHHDDVTVTLFKVANPAPPT